MTDITPCYKCGKPPKVELVLPEIVDDRTTARQWHFYCETEGCELCFLFSEREHDEAVKVWSHCMADMAKMDGVL